MSKSLSIMVLALVFLGGCASAPQAGLQNSRTTGVAGPQAPRVSGRSVAFALEAPEATLVTIAGQFNGWDKQATPLERGDDGIWRISLELRPGRHRYKFILDGVWLPDPHNPRFEPDGFGHYNSLVEVAR